MFTYIVDVIAKRYGWSLREIREELFWEELWELYELSSNMEAMDKNEQRRFDFMIHAQSKEALDAWEDATLPFPGKTTEKIERKKEPPSLVNNASLAKVGRIKRDKMTSEDKERYNYVLKRMQEHRTAYGK